MDSSASFPPAPRDLGRVIASGTPAEVQGNDAVLTAYLGAAR